MNRLIIDAGVLLNLYVTTELTEKAEQVISDKRPVLIDFVQIETANALRNLIKHKIIETRLATNINQIINETYRFTAATEYISKAFDLAVQYDHGIYDCLYVAAAIDNNAELVTTDKKLSRKFAVELPHRLINLYDL